MNSESEDQEKEHVNLAYLNRTPMLLSIFYDADMMPEQLERGTRQWAFMIGIICGWRTHEAVTIKRYHIT